LAANIPERKAERRIREQARSYKKLSKVGTDVELLALRD
jgi:hypothetical protein